MSGTLGYLLQQNAEKSGKQQSGNQEKSKRASQVADLFSKEKAVLSEPVIVEDTVKPEDQEDEQNPFLDENMTAKQKKERDDRTVFVGNISLEATGSQIAKEFKEYGKKYITTQFLIIRLKRYGQDQFPLNLLRCLRKHLLFFKRQTDLLQITNFDKESQTLLQNLNRNNMKQGADRKNAYILFSTQEEAQKSLEANGRVFLEKHLRVDKANEKILDYTRTVFVGNLSFKITEEQLRKHFEDCGDILNVRVIRDPTTHEGKGFGYIFFKEKSAYQNGLQKNGTTLLQREIRVKKAVPAERLEKKKESVAKKVISKNKDFAIQRLKSKLKGKAIVHDEENEGEEVQQKPLKKVKKNSTGPSETIPAKIFQKMTTTSFNENENDIYDFKNEMSIAPRILRKKIKKLSKKGIDQNQAFKKVQRLKQTKKQNNDKNIFNSKFTLQARKDARFKKAMQNKKKGKQEVLKEDRKDGGKKKKAGNGKQPKNQ